MKVYRLKCELQPHLTPTHHSQFPELWKPSLQSPVFWRKENKISHWESNWSIKSLNNSDFQPSLCIRITWEVLKYFITWSPLPENLIQFVWHKIWTSEVF